MKRTDVEAIIERYEAPESTGYRVSFDVIEGSMLRSDMVPDRSEPAIANEAEAWNLAGRLARATRGRFVNFYVIYASNYSPVPGYKKKEIVNR